MSVFNYYAFDSEEIQINHHLSRKSKVGFMLFKTPALEKEECNITTYLKFSEEYNEIVKEFNDTMETAFTEQKAIFNHNIKTVKIKDSKNGLFRKAMNHFRKAIEQGSYCDNNNTIEIRVSKTEHKQKIKNVVMHELIHMSSNRDVICTGFHQSNVEKSSLDSLGRGVNEGYTEKLNQEYFSKYYDRGVYDEEIVLASGIERIVGKKKMHELYFNADLKGLMRGINHYVNDMNEVANLIYGIDKLGEIRNEAKREDEYQQLREKIAGIYATKLELEYNLNLINEEQYERKKFFYIDQYVERGIAYSDDVKITEKSAIYWIEDGAKKDFIKKGKEPIKFRPDKIDVEPVKVEHNVEDLDAMFEEHPKEKEYGINSSNIDELNNMLEKHNPNVGFLLHTESESKSEIIEMVDDKPTSSTDNKYAK